MSRGFELAVAAFEPEAKTWSRLRTTLSLRSHAATLFLETLSADYSFIRTHGYPVSPPGCGDSCFNRATVEDFAGRQPRPGWIRFMPEPDVSLDFVRLGPTQK